jgi:hypothetical protein
MDFWQRLKETDNFTETENGAGAYKSTLNACLDAFGSLGAMRKSDDTTIVSTFEKAFNEDKVLAMRMLFWLRDIRGGIGERRAFRLILKWLAERHPEYVLNNLSNILEYGRGDDYLCLLDTQLRNEVADFLKKAVERDLRKIPFQSISLLGKWLPSINTSSKETKRYANILAKAWGWSPRRYRRTLSALRLVLDVTERTMSEGKWTNIDYEKVPAKAAMNYSDAFFKHDEVGYSRYLIDVANGNAKVKSKTLFPVDIVHKIMSARKRITGKDIILYNALWDSLPNYFEKSPDESSICVVDVSGSMSGEPMEVAISLGMYCADKCHGPFHNKFITFSDNPRLVEVRGKDLYEKVYNVKNADWGNSTNIEAVFNLILATAVQNHCKQEDLPSKLYIISDMQFNDATHGGYYDWRRGKMVHSKPMTFMQQMRQRYADAGYEMPALVYWNVRASQCGMFQETIDGENIAMVSGYSAKLFESVIEGTTYEETVNERGETVTKQKIDPMTVMLTTLGNERYDKVWTGRV